MDRAEENTDVRLAAGFRSPHRAAYDQQCVVLMGAQLVAEVLARWTHLADRPFRVLVRMALTALDRPTAEVPAGVYFAGRDLLAMTLRADGGSEKNRHRTVARAIAELIEQGAVERADSGRQGHNAVYRLTLKGGSKSHPETALTTTTQGGSKGHPQGGSKGHPQGGSWSPPRVAPEATPRTQEEPIEELYEETWVEETTTSHRSRVNRPSDETAPVIPLFPTPRSASPPPVLTRRDAVADSLAEAAARRAAVRAEYQARLAAGETP